MLCASALVAFGAAAESRGGTGQFLAPSALAVSEDGKAIVVACSVAGRVLALDHQGAVLNTIRVPDNPSGLALSPDGKWLFVTCAAPRSRVCLVDLAKNRVAATLIAGHTATAPVTSKDGKTLYVCNRFDNDISVFDLETRRETGRIAVQREPVASDITPDGKHLFVANHLPAGRADVENAAAIISVIDTQSMRAICELRLPGGSGQLNDIRISPDGQYAAVTHLFSSYSRAANRVDMGWVNANALTVVDLKNMRLLQTVLLDTPRSGAANPWAAAWSADGQTLIVTHAGTHEISLIDFQKLAAGLTEIPASTGARKTNLSILTYVSHYEGLDTGLPFLTGARQRIRLPAGDLGPRSVVVSGDKAFVANYFSDTITILDLYNPQATRSIALGPKPTLNAAQKGERLFNDATLCKDGWQSCASCHPDGRADGFNWDLLNDGIGNPKNTKSLLLSHKTPPAMSLGIRETAETAVRSGIKNILFTDQPEDVAESIDAYLKSLQPVQSPHLTRGKLSASARRGQKIFKTAGCAQCHPPGLFTDLRPHDVGTRRAFDAPSDIFDTPTLIEAWRTAPYLHDGSAATLRDVLTARNPRNEHGQTSTLSPQELDDLCAYVLSL